MLLFWEMIILLKIDDVIMPKINKNIIAAKLLSCTIVPPYLVGIVFVIFMILFLIEQFE